MLNVTETVSSLTLAQTTPFSVELHDTATPIDALTGERDAAVAKLSRYDHFDQKIDAANQAREAASAALRQFLGAETASLRAWAESSDASDAPTRDADAYGKLVATIEDCDRTHEAAVVARASIEPFLSRARAELQDIQIRIDYRRAHSIADEVLREVDELKTILDDALTRHARILACREALWRRAWRFRDNNQIDRSSPWNGAAQRLADIAASLSISPNQTHLANHFAHWSGKIEGSTPEVRPTVGQTP